MARIANIEIPTQKRGEISLTYIFGIGKSSAQKILKAADVDPDKKVGQWTEDETQKIREVISESYTVEGNLKRLIKTSIMHLGAIGSRRGIRHRLGLPVRGQNTKNNARTRRGKKKTMPGKKK